ncbi:hypothetical protein KC717_03930 [Candidatus Dojkabacteria bacterium]|uniref:Uncharacterized protein n=1 Tax=Candidatus Dojkabacteria bacterium TaxID=2099670 RepID=A0A955L8P9_9BACT|nr:hypothetical protein [Candidatus Dojkabacteria bacterium]
MTSKYSLVFTPIKEGVVFNGKIFEGFLKFSLERYYFKLGAKNADNHNSLIAAGILQAPSIFFGKNISGRILCNYNNVNLELKVRGEKWEVICDEKIIGYVSVGTLKDVFQGKFTIDIYDDQQNLLYREKWGKGDNRFELHDVKDATVCAKIPWKISLSSAGLPFELFVSNLSEYNKHLLVSYYVVRAFYTYKNRSGRKLRIGNFKIGRG